jgi:antitoxin PrlF
LSSNIFLIDLIFPNFKKSLNLQRVLGLVVTHMPKSKECCKIDAVVSVDSKGQIVLPKDLRERANIQPNDKLALIGMEREGEVCCLVLMKTECLSSIVKGMLGPIFHETFEKGGAT